MYAIPARHQIVNEFKHLARIAHPMLCAVEFDGIAQPREWIVLHINHSRVTHPLAPFVLAKAVQSRRYGCPAYLSIREALCQL
jgi:hypothetical protein